MHSEPTLLQWSGDLCEDHGLARIPWSMAEGLFLMSRFDIIRVGWPVALIAAGLEELYLWATSGDDQ